MADENNNLLKEKAEILKKITELQEQGASRTSAAYKEQIQALVKVNEGLAKISKSQEKNRQYAKGMESLASGLSSVYKGQAKQLKAQAGLFYDVSKNIETSLARGSELSDKNKDQADIVNDILAKYKKQSDLAKELSELTEDDIIRKNEIQNQFDDITVQIQSQLTNVDAMTRVGGDFLRVQREIQQSIEEQRENASDLANLSKENKDILEAQAKVFDDIKKKVATLGSTLTTYLKRPQAAIGAMVAAVGTLANKVGKVNTELGTSMFQTDGIARNAGLLSFMFDGAAANAKDLANELGSTDKASLSLQTNVNLMAENMGISGNEATKLIGSFSRMNGNSTEVASDMVATSKEFAKQNGIIPSQLMSDLAGATEEFALFGKDGGKNILEAAGYARKLGVSMDAVTKATESLLDFETSMTKELELSAMLGRSINLNSARALAYQGDMKGAVQETLKQLGGVEAFNQMDYYQKKQTADLLGISVEELDKMAKNQENAGSMGAVMNEEFSKMGEFLDQGLNKYLGTGLQGLGGMITMAGQLDLGFKAMGLSMKGIVGKIWKGIKGMGMWVVNSVKFLANMIKSAALSIFKGGFFKGAVNGLKSMVSLSGDFLKNLVKGKAKQEALDAATGGTGKSPLSSSPTEKINKVSGKGGMNVGNMLKGAAAILVLSAALFVAAKAFQEFGDVTWDAVGMGLVGLAGLATIALVLGKAQGEMIKGAIAVAILGAALIPFAFSMSLIAGLDIGAVLAAAAGLVIFSAAIFGLGALMMTGAGAFIFGAGLLALVGLGVAMMILGDGLVVVSSAMERFVASLSSIGPLIAELGASLSSVVGLAGSILLFAGSLALLSYALVAFGISSLLAAPGIFVFSILASSLLVLSNALNSIIGSVSGIGNIVGQLLPLTTMIIPIFALAGAITALGLALAFLGTTGFIGLAVLAGVAALAEPIAMIAGVLGIGEGSSSSETGAVEKGSLSEYETTMLQKMDVLIDEVRKGRDVYINKDKLTDIVMKTSERKTQNVFGLGVA